MAMGERQIESERGGDRDGVIGSEMDLKGRRGREIKGKRKRGRENRSNVKAIFGMKKK